jgi:plastocyanin
MSNEAVMVKWFLLRFSMLFGGALVVLNAMAGEINDEENLKVRMFDSPRRDVSVIVTQEGYYPEKISVFQGEKVKFFVTSTVSDPSCFLISEHDIYLSAYKGNLTEGEVHFKQPGHYNFYCPSMSHKGTITVIRKKRPGRGIASEKKKKKVVWTPKD